MVYLTGRFWGQGRQITSLQVFICLFIIYLFIYLFIYLLRDMCSTLYFIIQ